MNGHGHGLGGRDRHESLTSLPRIGLKPGSLVSEGPSSEGSSNSRYVLALHPRKGERGMPAKAKGKYAVGAANLDLFRALADPTRGRILVILTEGEAGTSELAEMLEEPFDNVAYHVRELRKRDLIEQVRETARRGRIYKATARPIIELSSWETLPQIIREINSTWVGQLIVGDLVAAIKAGTFDERPERTMLRTQPQLDEEGLAEVEQAGARYLEAVFDAEANSTERLANSDKGGFRVSASALAFKMPAADKTP